LEEYVAQLLEIAFLDWIVVAAADHDGDLPSDLKKLALQVGGWQGAHRNTVELCRRLNEVDPGELPFWLRSNASQTLGTFEKYASEPDTTQVEVAAAARLAREHILGLEHERMREELAREDATYGVPKEPVVA
jgi:hypothetical protein